VHLDGQVETNIKLSLDINAQLDEQELNGVHIHLKADLLVEVRNGSDLKIEGQVELSLHLVQLNTDLSLKVDLTIDEDLQQILNLGGVHVQVQLGEESGDLGVDVQAESGELSLDGEAEVEVDGQTQRGAESEADVLLQVEVDGQVLSDVKKIGAAANHGQALGHAGDLVQSKVLHAGNGVEGKVLLQTGDGVEGSGAGDDGKVLGDLALGESDGEVLVDVQGAAADDGQALGEAGDLVQRKVLHAGDGVEGKVLLQTGDGVERRRTSNDREVLGQASNGVERQVLCNVKRRRAANNRQALDKRKVLGKTSYCADRQVLHNVERRRAAANNRKALNSRQALGQTSDSVQRKILADVSKNGDGDREGREGRDGGGERQGGGEGAHLDDFALKCVVCLMGPKAKKRVCV
jgi:hypothetical protein